jgi:hypothetical protein
MISLTVIIVSLLLILIRKITFERIFTNKVKKYFDNIGS